MARTASTPDTAPAGLADVLRFPLFAALTGRRARRFSMGASISDGPLAFSSRHEPTPLTDLERMLVLTAAGGSSGWNYLITRNARYAPHLANYSGSATGRTFPSAAAFHTSELFFTDDDGVYLFATRDAGNLAADDDPVADPVGWVDAHRGRIRKVSDGRLDLPPEEPHMEGHNTWCANRPGSLLVIPVADLAQHQLAILCFFTQNGLCVYDDINGGPIPGMDRFADLVAVDEPVPLSFTEQYTITEATAELATACYAGVLMLQAMGLGGWMYDGLERHSVLGASGDPAVKGLGFRYDTDPRWPLPNPTGREGVFEAFCPPHYPDMRTAVEAFTERKFGPGGPFHPDTPGPWKESARIRSAAVRHDDHFKDCVTLQAEYIYQRFGRFPGTVPSTFCLTYLQAHHLDLDFYDTNFGEGAYLTTHADHMANWH